jgi:hypothetical protein
MANLYSSARYVESVERLALGLEAIDALRGARIPDDIRITFDEVPRGLPRPSIVRHDSAVFALLYGASVGDSIVIRVFDSEYTVWTESRERRRFVPRRFRIPLLAADEADDRPVSERIRRPALFPGAAYETPECMTGMRGRVVDDDVPVRWARIQAVDPVSGATVGRAHCDDRGEFLLLIDSNAGGLAELSDPLELQLRVHLPTTPIVAASIKAVDPLWDLPIELVPDPGVVDDVSAGNLPWPEWTLASTTAVEFPLGALLKGQPALTV